jgi:hypothetical protein
MLHLTISLRALVFVLLLSAVALTGSDVAHRAPSAQALTDVESLVFRAADEGARDIRTGDNDGGLRLYSGTTLANPPQGAALQFFGNDRSTFNGQVYIDSGAHSNAAIIFHTAGNGGSVGERMRITAGGNVGIGTGSPADKFTVQTGTFKYGIVHTDGNVSVGTFVGAGGFDPAGGWYGTKSNHPLYFFTADSFPRMTLTTGGNVGIGTTNPIVALDVVTGTISSGPSASSGLRVYSPGGGLVFQVNSDGTVDLSLDGTTSTQHVCKKVTLPDVLSLCGSAA